MSAVSRPIAADQRGFTLIEVIVTIIISAVLAVILAQVIGNQTSRSYRPIQVINENLALRAVMENIAADCRANTTNQVLQNRLDSGSYWDSSFTNGIPISASSACIGFDPSSRQEVSDVVNCTFLKVTLTVQGTSHSLTALFAP
jgi:prepilin-type N-terminal cleavage/methylation domain-containing protein